MVINLTGYHGTDEKNLESIRQQGINNSDKGWFGTGSYFYKDSFDMALKWAKKNHANAIVIVADIHVDEDKILDLTDPSGDHARSFHDIREEMFSKFKGKYKDQLDNIVINTMHEIWKFNVVKGISHSFESFDKRKLGSNIPNGVEIVVRNKECIKSLEKVE